MSAAEASVVTSGKLMWIAWHSFLLLKALMCCVRITQIWWLVRDCKQLTTSRVVSYNGASMFCIYCSATRPSIMWHYVDMVDLVRITICVSFPYKLYLYFQPEQKFQPSRTKVHVLFHKSFLNLSYGCHLPLVQAHDLHILSCNTKLLINFKKFIPPWLKSNDS